MAIGAERRPPRESSEHPADIALQDRVVDSLRENRGLVVCDPVYSTGMGLSADVLIVPDRNRLRLRGIDGVLTDVARLAQELAPRGGAIEQITDPILFDEIRGRFPTPTVFLRLSSHNQGSDFLKRAGNFTSGVVAFDEVLTELDIVSRFSSKERVISEHLRNGGRLKTSFWVVPTLKAAMRIQQGADDFSGLSRYALAHMPYSGVPALGVNER